MLTLEYSRQRQRGLLEVLARHSLDAVVISLPHHVYYFTAHLPGWQHQSALVLLADGRSWLTTANVPVTAAADEIISYEAAWNSTLRQEQPAVVAGQVCEFLRGKGLGRIGLDASMVASQVTMAFDGEAVAIDVDLWQLRRRKYPDELALMRKAITCCEAMYARAREVIEPGVPELHVFGELHSTAVMVAGEPLTALLGNDYACGVPGGPARGGKVAKAGEIYILDLGPVYRGYFSDNCRAFAVDRKPTDAQVKCWEMLTAALKIVETMAGPGVHCRDIYTAVDDHFRDATGAGLTHHLGHGVGLQPHEFPHLNRAWDDVLIEGEIFTAEPGLYSPSIHGGIRLENDYLVTATGVTNLLDAPLDLA